jgi:phenylalanyl-tRNA synthetase alpha chain
LAAVSNDLLSQVDEFVAEASQRVADVSHEGLGELDEAERKDAGRRLNEARTTVGQLLEARSAQLDGVARAARYEAERLDLTEYGAADDRGHLHLVTQARDRLEDLFVGMGYKIAEGPEVETAWYNFEALNIPDWHPARGSFDTIFVELGEPEEVMLRSHTSPVQIRVMETTEPPIYIVAPGRTFRSDTADATHLPAFNQIEGLVIDKGITMGDLAGTIDEFVRGFFGTEVRSRLRPSYFPFTEPSAEFDISRPDGSWLELGGCGMVHPNVLRNCGIDPEVWQGFAFGFGIDRLAVMRYALDDIRELVNNDVRFLRQF